MREQAKNKFRIKDVLIGGADQLICIPLVALDTPQLLQQAENAILSSPDLLEWRADSFLNPLEIEDAAKELHKIIKNIPLIFTLRHQEEGGVKHIAQELRKKIMHNLIADEMIDLLDLEIINGKEVITEIKKSLSDHGLKLILSYHDFSHTPSEEFIIAKLKEAQELGADVAKVAVMPENYRAVLRLFNASMKARELVDIPLITISMGSLGIISRVAGGYFGSDVTFAAGETTSAPGQLSIDEVREIMRIIS